MLVQKASSHDKDEAEEAPILTIRILSEWPFMVKAPPTINPPMAPIPAACGELGVVSVDDTSDERVWTVSMLTTLAIPIA